MESLADEAFGDLGAVGVGGVYEGDAEVDGAAEDAAGFVWIVWFAPGAVADKAHGSVTETVDGENAADLEGTASGMARHTDTMLNGEQAVAGNEGF